MNDFAIEILTIEWKGYFLCILCQYGQQSKQDINSRQNIIPQDTSIVFGLLGSSQLLLGSRKVFFPTCQPAKG